jgi:phosphoribosylanthranilate isomerase
MTTRIKICGVTLPDDAAAVASAGIDYIGLNFWPKSKRYLAPERAPLIAGVVRGTGGAKLVGVFVDPTVDEVMAILGRVELDVIQLHGDEKLDDVRAIQQRAYRPVWKAISVASAADIANLDAWPVDAILLDAPAARVRHARNDASTPRLAPGAPTFDHQIARDARERYPRANIVLAGGLDASNVAAAIVLVQPWCVDVASGVEAAPGIKDRQKLAAFVAAVRG